MQASGRAADRLATNQRATVHLPGGKRATLLLGSLAATVAALYLNNPSLPDALLYPLLAVIGALPLILLVAALAGLETRAAANRIIEALGSFGGMAPQTPEHGRRRTLGVALGLFLGAVLSVLLSYAADQLMPKLRFILHSDNEKTVWALNDPNGDWKAYRTRYKSSFLSHTGGTEADWQTQKHSLGRGSVRVARTLFGFSLLLGLAGAVDVIRRRYRRGFPVLIAALTVSLILYSTWYDREGNYVTEMISASGRLPESLRPQLPASAPDALQRLVADRAP